MARGLFQFERQLFQSGLTRVAGVDEAGRGPLAGPVTAAAVILPCEWFTKGLPRALRGLNDSKQVPPERREYYFGILIEHPEVRYGLAHVEVETIEVINILRATHQAMNAALAQLQPAPEHVLVDGRAVPGLDFDHTPLVDGDCRSYSIAAASIVAKVSRDRLMLEYDRAYPLYGFKNHKGYSTPEHFAAIVRHGPCPIHRRTFAPFLPKQPELFEDPSEPGQLD